MKRAMTRVSSALGMIVLTAAVALAQPTSKSQTSQTGTPTEKTQTLSGTVVQVDGNTLVVQMSSGETRMFNPSPEQRFVIDGKEVTLRELQPGTRLKATVTEISTPVTDRTVEKLEGTVWYASGSTVILTLPNGENRQYQIKSTDPVKFQRANGQAMTVEDLRKGMSISATRITEAPRTELVTKVAVTGSAPVKEAPAATTGVAPAPAAPPPPRPAEAAPAPPPQAAAPAEPRQLPRTASPLPLLGLAGLVSLVTGAALTVRRRMR